MDEEELRAQLEAGKQQRAKDCGLAIDAILKQFHCQLLPWMHSDPNGIKFGITIAPEE